MPTLLERRNPSQLKVQRWTDQTESCLVTVCITMGEKFIRPTPGSVLASLSHVKHCSVLCAHVSIYLYLLAPWPCSMSWAFAGSELQLLKAKWYTTKGVLVSFRAFASLCSVDMTMVKVKDNDDSYDED
eukprot:3377023-Amphidinium_carterae.1